MSVRNRVIGIDEAGLGPNLGPFVQVAVAWNLVPTAPGEPDAVPESLWTTFAPILSSNPPSPASGRPIPFHIADSKAVYKAGSVRQPLERGAAAALALVGKFPKTLGELLHAVDAWSEAPAGEPWFAILDQPLGPVWQAITSEPTWQTWRKLCDDSGFQPVAVSANVVFASEFNSRCQKYQNKSTAVVTSLFELLKRQLQAAGDSTGWTQVLIDKQGGRNFYAALLQEHLAEDAWVHTLCESPLLSQYRIGTTELQFQPRAEVHFPVALASIVAKTIRELCMDAFNDWWKQRFPDLKPTKGYPVDAQRFRREIAAAAKELGLSEGDYWRTV